MLSLFYKIVTSFILLTGAIAAAELADSSEVPSVLPPIPRDIAIIPDGASIPIPKIGSELVLVSPLYDDKFKEIFGTEGRSEARTIAFLNAIWGFRGKDKIIEIKFLPVARRRDDLHAQSCFFDIMCIDGKKNKYIVEMQKQEHQGLLQRMFYYSAVEFTRQGSDLYQDLPLLDASKTRQKRSVRSKLRESTRKRIASARKVRPKLSKSIIFYRGLLPVKTIVIANFSMFKDRAGYLHFADVAFRAQPRDVCSDILAWCFIELPKFNVRAQDISNDVERWIFLLQCYGKMKLSRKLIGPKQEIFNAYKIINYCSREQITELRALQKASRDAQSVLAQNLYDAEAKGMDKGDRRRQLLVARKMKEDGLPVATIIKYTGLTATEIADL